MNECMNPMNRNNTNTNTNNMNDCMNPMNITNSNNMNDCMNITNTAYYINNINMNLNNMNNMNLNNTNPNINKKDINNMNSCNLNMNNINAKLNTPFSISMMMNQSTMKILNDKFKTGKNNSKNVHFILNRNQNEKSIIQNGGVLPRTNEENNNKVKEDSSFPKYTGNTINIIFETGSGLRYIFPVSENIPMKELLLKFIRKVGISESLMGNKILFILNGSTIPAYEERSIKTYYKEHNFSFANNSKIIVIDGSNVIGA